MSYEFIDLAIQPAGPAGAEASVLLAATILAGPPSDESALVVPSTKAEEGMPILADGGREDELAFDVLLAGADNEASRQSVGMTAEPGAVDADGTGEQIDTIVVIAKKKDDGDGFYRTYMLVAVGSPVNESYGGGGTIYASDPSSGDGNDDGVQSAVNVQVKNAANGAEARQAAENVAEALTEIESFLNNLDPNTQVQWFDGDIITASEALQMMANTQFIVDDTADYGNGGDGYANRGQNGAPNTVRLNFESFDGDGGDYASSNYINSQGVIGQVLHELGHVTADGYSFDRRSHMLYKNEHGSDIGFNGSEYWWNNEAYAYEFSEAMASAMGFSITQFWNQLDHRYTSGAVDPIVIYGNNQARYSAL